MKTSTILAFGAFGGCCPTIAKLASFYSTNPAGGLPQLGTYIGLGLFALLGSFIAVGFGAKELKAAIVAGIAAPGLVTNIVAGSSAANAAAKGQQQAYMHGIFVSAAYAQAVEETFTVETLPAFRGGRLITLDATFDGPVPTDGQVQFRFVDANGSALAGGGTIVPGEDGLVVAVPDGAVSISIGPETVPITATGDLLNVTIMTAPSLGGDLLWALGAARAFTVKDIDATFSGGS